MTLLEYSGLAVILFGVLFFVVGTLGLYVFPDTLTRLHALTKADTVGLGLITLGAGLFSASLLFAFKLLLIWLLLLIASTNIAHLIASAQISNQYKDHDS